MAKKAYKMKKSKVEYKELGIEQIEPDLDQPRKDLGVSGEETRLVTSMKEIGLRVPLSVIRIGNDKYKLIDGHRRFASAKILGYKTVRCQIHPEAEDGEIKRVRYEIQNNSRNWKTTERAQEIKKIKKSMNFRTNKELAEHLHCTEVQIGQSLSLEKRREKYQRLMDEYELSDTYQDEFIKMEPKIRKIRNFSKENIIENIFERVGHQVIRSAKDFRKLGSIFLRAQANEKEIIKFIKDRDMTVDEIFERTTRSGLVRDLESVKNKIGEKLNQGIELPKEVITILESLVQLYNKSAVK